MWLDLLWTVVIWGAVFAILWWGLVMQLGPKMPAPFQTVILVILTLAVMVVCISLLLGRIPLIPFGTVGTASIDRRL